jgi:hypothetical protein
VQFESWLYNIVDYRSSNQKRLKKGHLAWSNNLQPCYKAIKQLAGDLGFG